MLGNKLGRDEGIELSVGCLLSMPDGHTLEEGSLLGTAEGDPLVLKMAEGIPLVLGSVLGTDEGEELLVGNSTSRTSKVG